MKNKKIMYLLVILLILVIATGCSKKHGNNSKKDDEYDASDFIYMLNLEKTGYIIAGVSNRDPYILKAKIPSKHNVLPVVGIGDYAFYGCSNLTSIEIPNSVTSIGEGAFYYCSNLTSIEIPNSVTSIGEYAFYYCSNLTIRCEANNKPSGWDNYWNPDNCVVVWGYKKYQ